MTALNYILFEEGVILAADSLSLTTEKNPCKYITKILILPHIRGAVCGTGNSDLLLDWYICVQKNIVCKDIVFLDHIAPTKLVELYATLNPDAQITSTIYHFGYSTAEARFLGYAYRSENDFASEALTYGMGIKPAEKEVVEFAQAEMDAGRNVYEILAEVVRKQKFLDDQKPIESRVGVGGQIHILSIQKNSMFFSECYLFPDYEDIFKQMLERLAKDGGIVPGLASNP